MSIARRISILTGVVLLLFLLRSHNLFAEEKLINLDVENMSITTVLKKIGQQSGLNISASKNVIGTVTVQLENVSVTQALDIITKTNNYLYTYEDDIVSVFTPQDIQQEERFAKKITKVFSLQHTDVLDLRRILLSMKTPRGKIELIPKNNQIIVTDVPDKIQEIEEALKELDQPMEIRSYKLLYAKADDIKKKLIQVIPEEKGEVFIDERLNSIVIKATSIILKDIDELVKGWDVRHRQVLIEAKILEIALDKGTKFGIDWQYKDAERGEKPSVIDLSGKLALNLKTAGVFKVGSLTSDEYTTTLEMLKTTADTDVLSSPRIVVIDGKEANILVGSSEPYIVTTTDPATNRVIEEVKFKEVGIKLIVTPQIGEDDYITMKIHPEVSTARRLASVEDALAIDTTQADTTMMVKDGETIMLGGLIKNTKKKIVNKIPILGDIPLIKVLFRNVEENDVKQELIVFITPHILTDESRKSISKEEWDKVSDKTKQIEQIENKKKRKK